MQRRQLNATLSARCKAVNAGPLAQCRTVSSVQRRQLSAAPSTQCRGHLFQCRPVCFNVLNAARSVCSTQKLLKARRHLNAVPCRLLHAGPVCSTRGPSAQRNAFLLNARPSARCKAVAKPSAQGRAVSSMQGCSFQCRAVCFNAGLTQCKTITSMQGHQVNARPTPQCMGVWSA